MKLILISIPLLLSAFVNVYFAFILQQIIDITSTGDVKRLLVMIGIACLYLVADILLSLFSKYISGKYIQAEILKLKNNRVKNHLENHQRDIVSSLTVDIELLERDYYQQKIRVIFNVFQFSIGLIAIIYISIRLTIAIALVTMIPLLVPTLLKKSVQRRKEAFSDVSKRYTEFLTDMNDGHLVIRDFSLSKIFEIKHGDINQQVETVRFGSRFIEQSVDIISQNLGMLTFITALGLGSYLTMTGHMTFGLMIASIQLMNSIVQPLNTISHSMNKMNSLKRIKSTLEESTPCKTEGLEINKVGTIELRNVSFSYGDKRIINNLNTTFSKDKTYVIVGESGCGKSTLLKILSGELTPTKGSVLINGVDLKTINVKSYKRLIAISRQSTHLFNDHLEANLNLFDTLDENSVNELTVDVKMSHLKHHNDSISGGQQQRVGIVRALSKKSNVLLMDEMTSSLDEALSESIIRTIKDKYLEEKIGIFVSHQTDQYTQIFDEVIKLS